MSQLVLSERCLNNKGWLEKLVSQLTARIPWASALSIDGDPHQVYVHTWTVDFRFLTETLFG
jgi:hypothetical protein